MAKTRVWNLTDDPNTAVSPQNLRVLGQLVVPGRFVTVDDGALVRAHKVHVDVKRGLLHVGMQPPAAYAAMKKPPRAKLASGVARKGLASNRPKKKVLELKDTVKVSDKAAVRKIPVPMPAPPPDAERPLSPMDEAKPDSDDKGKKKRGK